MPKFSTSAAVILGAALALTIQAQPKGGRGGNPVQPIKQIKPGFYMVGGAGANSGVRVTSAGVILVDGKLPSDKNYDDLIAQIKSVTDQPVKYLIVTHHHSDHAGNNQRFRDAGIPIVVHEDLNKQLLTYKANPVPAQGTITYTDEYVVKLGGAEADVHHFAAAHTGGDSVVYFPDLKIAMVSDEVTSPPTGPLVDYAGGGTALGFITALNDILKLDFDTVIAGNGEPMTRSDVETYRKNFETMISRSRELIKSGTPKDQFMAKLDTSDLGWKPRIPNIDAFYQELSK